MGALNREIASAAELEALPVGSVVIIGVNTTIPDSDMRADMALQNVSGQWYFVGAPFEIHPVDDLRDDAFPALLVYEQ
ncbi:hypothetical protein EniyanLRS_54 [Mycobacterium phage EniyanLRS]|uniref:Uncharacterized protein n=1 Tax=Mycobacterium phage EniyanLRS TaxID=1933770 RepID=A0A2I2MPF6_9CAUD|nr:hypothetical protein EniyanLRS_54 [Mycobacterium phage EniyanLRS]